MKNEELTKLSNEELKKKEKNMKTLMGLFIPIILGLLYFGVRDYLDDKINTPITIITICSIGGLTSLFPGLKRIQEELKSRGM